MLTMTQILKKTPADRFAKASSSVKVGKYKAGFNKKMGFPMVLAETWSIDKGPKGEKRTKYTTFVQVLTKRGHVKCSCSCEDFLYRWEWALNQKGAADIFYSNGDPSTFTNPPPSVPGCCKHLVALWETTEAQKLTQALLSQAPKP